MAWANLPKEKAIHKLWIDQHFKTPLITQDHLKINIINTGEYNQDSHGPDFNNARVQIGNITYVGDVEIHRSYSDWKRHGHNIDKRYNRVVLHVCFEEKFKQPYVYNKEGRKIPTIYLSDFIDETQMVAIKNLASKEKSIYILRCMENNDAIPMHVKKKYLAKLGMQRFQKKCNRLYSRLLQIQYESKLKVTEPDIRYDLPFQFYNKTTTHNELKDKLIWKQLLHEFIFEALGYSQNKSIMMKLAKAVNVQFIGTLEKDHETITKIESTMFNVSGIMSNLNELKDEDLTPYVLRLKTYWEDLSKIYSGPMLNETDWHFFRLRPHNFPTIRIAGGVEYSYRIVHDDFIESIIKMISEIRNFNIIISKLRSLFVIKANGYWAKHYTFNKLTNSNIKYFVGISRVDEILINVILPYLSLYFTIFNKKYLAKKVINLFNLYKQIGGNKIVNEIAESLQFTSQINRSIFSQGMIELFRVNCSKSKCLECEFGKIIFN